MFKLIIRLYNQWLDAYEEIDKEIYLFYWYPSPLPWMFYINPERFEKQDKNKD
jgi:hypothetical protein